MKHQKKKRFGQHFLKDTRVCEKMIAASNVTKKDIILEIGPGEGVLTAFLLAQEVKIIAVEKDRDLIPLLTERFSKEIKEKKLKLVEGDIRDLPPKKLGLKNRGYKVIANIPYYISGLLFRFLLENEVQPSILTFLVQKEVAERISKETKKENLLSLSVKAFGQPSYIGTVKRGAFSPPPGVDSAILSVHHISRENFSSKKHEEAYFTLIKKAFRTPRKQIGGIFKNDGKILALFSEMHIGSTMRPEDITHQEWLTLSHAYSQKE